MLPAVGHLPQEGLVLDDADVFSHVGGGGGDEHQLTDIVVGGALLVGAQLLELVQHSHRVDLLREIVHGGDGLKELPVLPEVKVLALEGLHHLVDALFVDEHGAQHGLFGLGGVGHLSGEKLVHIRSPPVDKHFAAPPPTLQSFCAQALPIGQQSLMGFAVCSGSGAGEAILILHISREQNRQGLFLGGPGAYSFYEKMAPGKEKINKK